MTSNRNAWRLAGALLLAAPFAFPRLLGQSAPAPAPTPVDTFRPPLAPGAQPQIGIEIRGQAGGRVPLAIPPAIAPITPELQAKTVDPFDQTISQDLGGWAGFVVTDPALYPKGSRPPQGREQGDAWMASGARYLLDTQVQPQGDQVAVIAELWDLKELKSILAKRYTGEARSSRKIAHVLANDIVRHFFGKPGPFLTKITFSSDRDAVGKSKEVYLMDWDGENQRRITYHGNLSLAPDWSGDGSKIVYQSYLKDTPGLYVISREGGEKKQIPLPTSLNASPSFSPDGKTIAYCGSVKGNPEIFTVNVDGTNLKRLTDSAAIDSTPRWSPNGRELAFTSNRQGSPQIYLMDLEGANVRRVTYDGTWNDEASFSPDGSKLAFACWVDASYQICVKDMDKPDGRTVQVSQGSGSSESPTWSPDGSKLAWETTTRGSSQIVVANADGSSPRVVTTQGSNYSPSWSRNLE